MPLERIEVGEPFPEKLPTGQEGLFPLLSDNGLIVCMCLSEASTADEHKLVNNPLKIGAMSYDHISFLVIQVQKWGTFDGYLQPFAYDPEYRREFIRDTSNMLHLCVTEGSDHVVRVNRLLGAEPDLMAFIRSTYGECAEHYDDGISVNRKVRADAYQHWPKPEDMLAEADETQLFR